jgi:putative flippase GtrA
MTVSVDATVRPPHSLGSSAWRFVLAGGLNTLVTGLLLSWLATVIDPRLAYTLVFALGIGIAVGTAGAFVFGVKLTRMLTFIYIVMYVTTYAMGLAVIALAGAAGMPPEWSGLVVLITAPLTFVGGRLLLTRRRTSETVHGRLV